MNNIVKLSKAFLLSVLFLFPAFILADVSVPYPATGSAAPGNGVFSNNLDVTLSWNITKTGNIFSYIYNINAPDKVELTSFILQTGSNVIPSDITNSSLAFNGPQTNNPSTTNPGLPASIFGIALNANPKAPFTYSFNTTLAPIWGNFYAARCNGANCNNPRWAYNTNFTTPPTAGSSSYVGWVPVPGNLSVPEPSTVLIIGSIIVGATLAGVFFRKRKLGNT